MGRIRDKIFSNSIVQDGMTFWCQKVLPLVYDDSLSYYEVLCKIIKYINGLLGDIQAVSNTAGNAVTIAERAESKIDQAVQAQVADGSITKIKLAKEVKDEIHQYANIYNSGHYDVFGTWAPLGIAVKPGDIISWDLNGNFGGNSFSGQAIIIGDITTTDTIIHKDNETTIYKIFIKLSDNTVKVQKIAGSALLSDFAYAIYR